jgi:hypothetical protein
MKIPNFSDDRKAPNGLRYRRLGEPTYETRPNSSLESSSKRGAHQPSGARFVGHNVEYRQCHGEDDNFIIEIETLFLLSIKGSTTRFSL